MTLRPFDRRAPKARRRLHLRSTLVLFGLAIALVAALAAGSGSASNRTTAASPTPGGTLKILGSSDIFNLDTTSAYYTVSNILERSFTRQLLGYRNTASFLDQIKLVPDIATAVPTAANGGITLGGRTYTLHIRQGVKWNTNAGPPGDGRRTSCASSRCSATRPPRPARRATTRARSSA